MISLQQIESDLTSAMKAKDQIALDTLRALKTRMQVEMTSAKGGELTEASIFALIRSEVKKRFDAAESFSKGGRQEAADKELKEAEILQKYLPAQMPESELSALIDQAIVGATATDFGKIMGKLKAQLGDKADGAILAKILKEKLK